MEQREKIQDRQALLRDGLISFGAIFLAYGALDDITTDNATSFPVERTMLVCVGAFFVYLAFRLWQERHRIIAVISLAMVGLAAWVQPWIGTRTTPSRFEIFAYLATITGLAWFLFVAVFLVSLAWRLRKSVVVQ